MSYKIYYDDGSTSIDEVTQPYRVICIAQPRELTGREVLRAHPYYIYKEGYWRPAEDLASLVQQVIYFAPVIEAVVMGIWTDEENYQEIIRRAMTDPELPRRSAEDFDRRR